MKNLICLLLVAFLATTTFAQRKGMDNKVDAAVDRMTKELDLTPEQQTKVRSIYQAKIDSKQKRSAQTREERSAARGNFAQQIEAVLTPEQIEKRKALKKEYKSKIKAERKRRGATSRDQPQGKRTKKGQRIGKMTPEMIENRAVKSTERLDRQVNLTDAQQVTAKAAYLNFFQNNQAIAHDTSLEGPAKKERMTELKQKHQAEIKSLLTEEQLAAKKENRKSRKVKKEKKVKKANGKQQF